MNRLSMRDFRQGNRTTEVVVDCMLLGGATLLPVMPFIRRLGFYVDDWSWFALYRASGDRTFADFFRTYYSIKLTQMRPAEGLYKAALVRLFGTSRLGYHVVNALVFVFAIWLFYFALRLALQRQQRVLAFTIPMVFALLPNYSSDRFAPFTFHIGLSILFFFMNLYAMLKASQGTMLSWSWAIISIAALIVSGLAYEVALPVFAFSLLIVCYLQWTKPAGERLGLQSLAFVLISNAIALVSVLIFKALTTTRYRGSQPILITIRKVALGATRVHFYEMGIRLPIVVLKCLLRYWNPTLCLLAVLLGALVFWHLLRIQRGTEAGRPTPKMSLALIGVGFLAFVAGNAIFLVTVGVTGFTDTGVENRTAIAASVGIAVAFVGLGGLLSTIAGQRRRLVFSLVLALLCASEFLITSTIGSFWAAAADQQQKILASIQHDIPKLAAGSVLVIDGVCPFLGPGVVFENALEMGGALQLLYRDSTLQGDVVRTWLSVRQHEIVTRIWGRFQEYPYGPQLMVYDLRNRTIRNLHNFAAAQEYFGKMGNAHPDCPSGDFEVPIF